MSYIICFSLALFIVLIGMGPNIALSKKIDFVEHPIPDMERKLHKEPKPYLGSLIMYIGFWVVIFFATGLNKKNVIVFLASLIIFLIGIVDDWYKVNRKDLAALPKMLVQLTACFVIYAAGIKFSGFYNIFTNTYVVFPELLSLILTILWIFGIITVINFSDGMDGLAGGLAGIAGFSLFFVALIMKDQGNAIRAITLAGVCLAYLKYNKYPSKVLMGDSGATFLGFILAVISLDGVYKQATVLSLFIPILIFALPIFDNINVIIRRIKQGKPIYIGDTNQLHFRLHFSGMSQKVTVYFMCLLSTTFSLLAIILTLCI